MATTLAPAGAQTYAPTIVATYELNPFESFVATISERPDGRRVASISRVKRTPDGLLRRMAVLEFGLHRTLAIASLVDEILRATAGEPNDG